MTITTEEDIIQAVQADLWMMHVLEVAQKLDLPDWWIGAGFLRNKVWDVQHGYTARTPLNDIDVIYFDKTDVNESIEVIYEAKLKQILNEHWSVTNQARMHIEDNDEPYESSTVSLAHWTETATAVALKLDINNELILNAPHGTMDLINLVVVPTPHFMHYKKDIYNVRLQRKNWQATWPKLKINYLGDNLTHDNQR